MEVILMGLLCLVLRSRQASAKIRFPDAPNVTLTNGPDAPDLGNRSYADAADAANANHPDHKGMFGIHGTLRDILGVIGDAGPDSKG
jgi:hypothetical protein